MRDKSWVVVDLDGTLAEYDHWRGPQHFGEPLPGASEFMHRLSDRFQIAIWTTRGDIVAVKAWLDAHNIPYDSINDTAHNPEGCGNKPIGVAYLDDRAVRFDGDYDAAYQAICELDERGV